MNRLDPLDMGDRDGRMRFIRPFGLGPEGLFS